MTRYIWLKDIDDKAEPDWIGQELESGQVICLINWAGNFFDGARVAQGTINEIIRRTQDDFAYTVIDENHPKWDELMAFLMKKALIS